MELDYDKDTKIDETALDVELLEQSNLARRYAKHLTQTRRKEARAHEKVKTIRSELINEANEDPGKTTGKAKPNSNDIEAYYRRDKGYKKAKEEWLDLAEELEFAELAQKEISYGRRRSIEGLITLHGLQWFAGPKAPRNLTKAKEDFQKRANKKIKMGRQK